MFLWIPQLPRHHPSSRRTLRWRISLIASDQTAAAPQAMASPELQQLKEDLAQLKQELQQLKEIPAALASLRQSVDRLAGSQQQIAGTIAKLGTQKPASPPRPAPAPAPKPLTPPQSEVR